jgi:hypothetical protein
MRAKSLARESGDVAHPATTTYRQPVHVLKWIRRWLWDARWIRTRTGLTLLGAFLIAMALGYWWGGWQVAVLMLFVNRLVAFPIFYFPSARFRRWWTSNSWPYWTYDPLNDNPFERTEKMVLKRHSRRYRRRKRDHGP